MLGFKRILKFFNEPIYIILMQHLYYAWEMRSCFLFLFFLFFFLFFFCKNFVKLIFYWYNVHWWKLLWNAITVFTEKNQHFSVKSTFLLKQSFTRVDFTKLFWAWHIVEICKFFPHDFLQKFRQINFFTKELYCKSIWRNIFSVGENFWNYTLQILLKFQFLKIWEHCVLIWNIVIWFHEIFFV